MVGTLRILPSTGPLPASSTPSTTSLDMSSAICCGIAEKCEYDLPARMSGLQMDGAMKTSAGGVSCSISCASICTSSVVSTMLLGSSCVLVVVLVSMSMSLIGVQSGGTRDASVILRRVAAAAGAPPTGLSQTAATAETASRMQLSTPRDQTCPNQHCLMRPTCTHHTTL